MNDNGYVRYQHLTRAEVLVIGPLTFVGLIVVNDILSIMQSFLAEPVLQPQIKTIDDIYNSPFPFIMSDRVRSVIFVQDLVSITPYPYEDWSPKVINMSDGNYQEHISTFNTSISFYEDADTIATLFSFQKHLNIKAYYNTKIEIRNAFHSYSVYPKFLFFVLDLWGRKRADEFENSLLKRNRARFEQLEEKFVPGGEFPTFIIYGWIASAILFAIEIIWKKFESRIQKYPKIFRTKFRKVCGILAEVPRIFRTKFRKVCCSLVELTRIFRKKFRIFCGILAEMFRPKNRPK